MKYKTKFYSALAVAACSVSLSSSAVAEEASADLTLKYQAGKTYHYSQTTNMLMDVAPGMQMNNLMVMSYRGDAKAHPKGVEVAIAYDAMRMKMKMGENVMVDYDSRKKDGANPQMAKLLGPVLDMKFSAIYDKNGKYLEAAGLDQLKLDPKSGLTKDSLEAMMKQATVMLPAREVEVGEEWKSSIKVPMQGMGKMELNFDQKLVSVEKNIATVEFTGNIKPFEVNENGTVVKVASKAITGSFTFDTDLQQLTKSEMNMELNMDAAGQKMSMSAITKQELTKVEDTK